VKTVLLSPLSTRASITWIALFFVVSIGACHPDKAEMTEANNSLIEARQAIDAGDTAKAMAALDRSIASRPMIWSYFERAKLHLQNGDERSALLDCQSALEISPEDPEILWLKGEIEKPANKRFQGEFKNPPSFRK
jgi:Tfp pilus assembly protein PilF